MFYFVQDCATIHIIKEGIKFIRIIRKFKVVHENIHGIAMALGLRCNLDRIT